MREERMNGGMDMEKRMRNRKGKKDIISEIFHSDAIADMLYQDFQKASGLDEDFRELERMLREGLKDPSGAIGISNHVSSMMAEQELSGFRQGFSIALRVMVQGLAGPMV